VESVHLGTESSIKFTPQLLQQYNTCTRNGYLESKVRMGRVEKFSLGYGHYVRSHLLLPSFCNLKFS